MGGANPAQIKALMKQMGIKTEDIVSERVIIETAEKRIVIESPNVQKIDMKGNVSWQIMGDAHEENARVFSEEDVKLVMEKTGKKEVEVRKVLDEANGEVAEAIVRLSE